MRQSGGAAPEGRGHAADLTPDLLEASGLQLFQVLEISSPPWLGSWHWSSRHGLYQAGVAHGVPRAGVRSILEVIAVAVIPGRRDLRDTLAGDAGVPGRFPLPVERTVIIGEAQLRAQGLANGDDWVLGIRHGHQDIVLQGSSWPLPTNLRLGSAELAPLIAERERVLRKLPGKP